MYCHRPSHLHSSSRVRAFSLLEVLAASVVFVLLVGVVLKMTQATADSWSNSTGKTEGFRDARMVFSTLTKAVSQATLNPYFDYVDSQGKFRDPASTGAFAPTRYMRRSDLHFISGKNLLPSPVLNPIGQAVFFQAPLGYTRTPAYADMEGFLNACGFYVFYGPDPDKPAQLVSALPDSHQRFRLMQFLQPSEDLAIYDQQVTGGQAVWDNTKWFENSVSGTSPYVSQLAENVVALVIHPKYSEKDGASAGAPLSTDYEYNSRKTSSATTRNQLPPAIELVMVVIDEVSAARLGNTAGPPNLGVAALFQDTSKLEDDIATLEKNLAGLPGNAAGNTIPLRYQIFRTEIALRGSKWSSQ